VLFIPEVIYTGLINWGDCAFPCLLVEVSPSMAKNRTIKSWNSVCAGFSGFFFPYFVWKVDSKGITRAPNQKMICK
jgi:hypothetical protein